MISNAKIMVARTALKTILEQFMPQAQRDTLNSQLDGEEGEGIAEIVLRVAETVGAMPKTYETDGQGGEAVVHLHYFAGPVDAWITEKDKGVGTDAASAQHQAFGKITTTGNKEDAELGYISIHELIWNGVELDLYWQPKKLKEI